MRSDCHDGYCHRGPLGDSLFPPVWLIAIRDEVAGLLETENDAVLSWAESLFDTYRSRAEPPPEE